MGGHARRSRSATTRAPVAVTVVTTTAAPGQRRRRPSTSGVAAIASPTDTAWIQQRGSGGSPRADMAEPLAEVHGMPAADDAAERATGA